MTINSDISKKKKAERDAKKQPMKNGIVITGAMQFSIGTNYTDASLAKWIATQEEQQKVHKWFKNDKPFLVILGSPGTGKSYLSAGILNYLFERHLDVYYMNHRRLMESLRKRYEEKKSTDDLMEKYMEKDWLILDDLGAAQNTEWQKEVVLDLIDGRLSDNKKTVITSNLSQPQVSELLGQRTGSRIFSRENEILQFWNADRRGVEEEYW